MQILRVAVLILSLSAVYARRVSKKRESQHSALSVNESVSVEGGKTTCRITENSNSLKYGIAGSWKVKNCMFCKFHPFLTDTLTREVIAAAEPDEQKEHCKCKTSPKFWEAKGLDHKFWFQYNMARRNCDVAGCKTVFLTWANMFNKKKKYPGDNDRMPVSEFVESQEGYDFHCDNSQPEGLILPSPASKIHELRLQIERCTDPEEKARLQKILDELLKDKEVEVFAYDVLGDWGPEHEADESADGEHHTFFLKPCKSQKEREITELHEIFELCGPGELGSSMKGSWDRGKLRVAYVLGDPWGPERTCDEAVDECQMVQNLAADEGIEGELLSFRLRPCKSPSGEEITDLETIFQDCGHPTSKLDADGFATLLPVKMDVTSKYAADAEFAEDTKIKYPCAEDAQAAEKAEES